MRVTSQSNMHPNTYNIFDFFSKTAAGISTKLDRKQESKVHSQISSLFISGGSPRGGSQSNLEYCLDFEGACYIHFNIISKTASHGP